MRKYHGSVELKCVMCDNTLMLLIDINKTNRKINVVYCSHERKGT